MPFPDVGKSDFYGVFLIITQDLLGGISFKVLLTFFFNENVLSMKFVSR